MVFCTGVGMGISSTRFLGWEVVNISNRWSGFGLSCCYGYFQCTIGFEILWFYLVHRLGLSAEFFSCSCYILSFTLFLWSHTSKREGTHKKLRTARGMKNWGHHHLYHRCQSLRNMFIRVALESFLFRIIWCLMRW